MWIFLYVTVHFLCTSIIWSAFRSAIIFKEHLGSISQIHLMLVRCSISSVELVPRLVVGCGAVVHARHLPYSCTVECVMLVKMSCV